MTKRIELTKGQYTLVDDDLYDYLNQWSWNATLQNGTWYARRTDVGPARKQIKMHRLITNAPDGMFVDHINGNGLDNRRSNLRICTREENGRNRKLYINSTTGFKGVQFRGEKKYRARVSFDGRRIHLGYFETAIDAAKAYNAAAIKYHGDFARLNQIKEG